jgi:hypothetical protein
VPSEPHEVLYPRLRDITGRVKVAVENNELDALPGLAQAHKDIMAALTEAGLSAEPSLLGLIMEIRDRVQEVTLAIGERRDQIGRQLKATGTKKKLNKAYGV